jgi:hypothetical protein
VSKHGIKRLILERKFIHACLAKLHQARVVFALYPGASELRFLDINARHDARVYRPRQARVIVPGPQPASSTRQPRSSRGRKNAACVSAVRWLKNLTMGMV